MKFSHLSLHYGVLNKLGDAVLSKSGGYFFGFRLLTEEFLFVRFLISFPSEKIGESNYSAPSEYQLIKTVLHPNVTP